MVHIHQFRNGGLDKINLKERRTVLDVEYCKKHTSISLEFLFHCRQEFFSLFFSLPYAIKNPVSMFEISFSYEQKSGTALQGEENEVHA